jgi:dTMP kinase
MDDREQVAVWADVKASVKGDSSARRRLRDQGLFVAFEGGEGSGKSTQIALLAAALREGRREVVVTHEPGATEVGAHIRELVLHRRLPLSPRAEALLFAADRAQHVDAVIRPALASRQIVLTDRYVDSSVAYQGVGRHLSVDEIRRISRWATNDLNPDLIVLLDISAAEGLPRARGTGPGDTLESESLDFHERVRAAFLDMARADPRHYRVIDATRPVAEVAAEIRAAVEALLSVPGALVRQRVEAAP